MSNVTDTYYASGAFTGYGAQIKVGQGDSPETFVAIPDINKITLGDMTTGIVDVTHLRSPDAHREKKATIRDSGPIAFEGNYRPDHGAHKLTGGDGFGSTNSLLYIWTHRVETNFEIELPADAGSDVISVTGVVTKYQPGELTVEGKMPFMGEITPLRAYFVGPS